MTSVLMLLGGLAVFLYGLRVMSDGLQKIAGNRLRAILAGLTRNRVSGVLSGFLITCAVQSSSATTVLVVSFANAGLLSLAQCLGLIMGANIGTTITGWIVALLGFKIKISAFALPIIGVGFPLSFMSSARARQLSEVLIGFGLLFLGLKFLKDAVPDVGTSPEALEWLRSLTGYGFLSTLSFVVVGTVLTVVVQSSSATMTITLTLAAKGWIDYELAAAMVLGENVGTTVTATLAAIGANRNAIRAARFHTLFNLIGVLWMLPAMPFVLRVIADTVGTDTPTNLAAFHTTFNVANMLLLIGFTPYMEKIVLKLVPLNEEEAEGGHLRYLETGLLGTPELATVEARRAVRDLAAVCGQMFDKVGEVINNPEAKLGKVVEEIKRLEVKTDEMEEEIVDFCSQLARVGTSQKIGRDVTRYLEMANDLERLADHCMNLVLLAERRYEKGYEVTEATRAELGEMTAVVTELLAVTNDMLEPDGEKSLARAKPLESRINKLRDRSRKTHARLMQSGEQQVREGLVFLDMMTNMEKIGDYCWNVCRVVFDETQER